MAGEKPKLTKKEIAFAVGAGIVATGLAAIAMEDNFDVVGYTEPPAIMANGPTEMTYDVADFNEIWLNGPQDVVVTYGEEFSVRSEGSALALGTLQARVSGDRLTIGPPEGFNMGNWQMLRNATFYVTMPSLSAVELTGYGDMQIDRVEGERFSAAIAGSDSTLEIADMVVDEAEITIAGSGEISLAGEAREARFFIGGSGDINAERLQSETANITIGGLGDVSLSVSDDARIAIGGRGDVDIHGRATCSVTQVGGGDVDCGLPVLPGMEADAAVEEETAEGEAG